MLPDSEVSSLLTQTTVDPDNAAFSQPTQPIGPGHDAQKARGLARERGFTFASEGAYPRGVVPSPEPREIVEIATIRVLIAHGVLVITAGGGGIPVVGDATGALRGFEAVVAKDLAAGGHLASIGDLADAETSLPGMLAR